jgi:hypothetical protein
MNQSEKLENLVKALLKVQSELSPVRPNAKNPMFKNTPYADLNAFVEESKPILTSNGLVIIQTLTSPSGESLSSASPVCGLSTMLLHESGEYISDTILFPVIKPEDNKAVSLLQQLGINITYMRRYAWASILGMISEEDKSVETHNNPTGVQNNDLVNRRKDTVNEIFVANPTKQDAYRMLFEEFGGVDKINDADKLAELIKKMKGVK